MLGGTPSAGKGVAGVTVDDKRRCGSAGEAFPLSANNTVSHGAMAGSVRVSSWCSTTRGDTDTYTHTEMLRQADRQTGRHTNAQAHRNTDTQTCRPSYRQPDDKHATLNGRP